MISTRPHLTLLAVNSTEWLNLCARGSIRMSKRRPIVISLPVTDIAMEKVFSTAPATKIDSSIDLFILVISDSWTKNDCRHRSSPREISILTIQDIISHHPITQEHFDYYYNIGAKCDVYIDSAVFEKSWTFWVTNETIHSSGDAAKRLQQLFSIPVSSHSNRVNMYTWDDIALLVLRPNVQIKKRPKHVETLIRNIRSIADAVMSTRDSEKFYIACSIEWIDVLLKRDPLNNKETRVILEAALTNANELFIGSPSEQTISALKYLEEKYPKAFTAELTPITIAHIILLLTESRTKRLTPETAASVINSMERQSNASTLMIFLLATSLGIERTNQLIRSMSTISFGEMNWDSTN